MKAHLEQKLKHATDVLVMMQDLVHELDLIHDIKLIMMLQNKIALQSLFIGSIKKQIATELKLERVDNIFHEPIQFDIKEIEGTYPNTPNAWKQKSTSTTLSHSSQHLH